MRIHELITHIEALAPLAGAAPWDHSGVQVAGTVQDVRRLAVTIDPTPEAVSRALDQGAQCVLTHHPLGLEPRHLDTPGPFLDVVRLVLSAGAWLYAAHTSLDARPAGPAGWLPRALGLTGTSVLEPTDPADPEVGIGLAGALPAPLSWPDFLAELGRHVARPDWSLSGPEPATVSRVAVCPGSGGSLFGAVAEARADVYVTGDVRYHQGLETPCAVVDVGHFTLEETMTRLMAEDLSRSLAGDVEVRFLEGRDPFRTHAPRAVRADRNQPAPQARSIA